MDKLVIKKLESHQLLLLMTLHEYNDPDEMIIKNSQRIDSGEIDIFCMFLNNVVIGELRVMYAHKEKRFSVKGKRAYLYAFRVREDCRGKGFGKKLMEYVLGILKENGYSEFTIGVEDDNKTAFDMYKAFGFDTLISREKEEYQGDFFEYNLYLKI